MIWKEEWCKKIQKLYQWKRYIGYSRRRPIYSTWDCDPLHRRLPLSARAAVKKVFGEAKHIRAAHYTLLQSSTQYLGQHASKPWPGMESKFERLLRFELFIPHLYYEMDDNIQTRSYVDAADDDQGLTVAVQSNITLQKSQYKPPDPLTSTAFFRQVTCLHPVMLPPVIWLELMQMARDDGAFAPIDIDSLDDFPMRLYKSLLPWQTHGLNPHHRLFTSQLQLQILPRRIHSQPFEHVFSV